MNVNRLLGILAILFTDCRQRSLCTETREGERRTGRWQVSDDITLKQAEERAFMEAKKAALQKAGVMENVWSVFGQITQEDGQELHEAYSQMNVLAIGGMVNVTNKKLKRFGTRIPVACIR